jgi:hypothetical protein
MSCERREVTVVQVVWRESGIESVHAWSAVC